jgi:5-methylcytosine-specific restriction enzyme A
MPKPDHRSSASQTYRHLYKTYQWQKLRKAHLATEPLCRMCKAEGRVTVATVCDHIDDKKKRNPHLFFDGPFQSLCKLHHDSTKQQMERTGYSSAIGEDGWPDDPIHPMNRNASQ